MTKVNTSQMITTAKAAESLRISPRHVRRICQDFGVGYPVTPRNRILSPSDVERIRAILFEREQRGIGRPRKKT